MLRMISMIGSYGALLAVIVACVLHIAYFPRRRKMRLWEQRAFLASVYALAATAALALYQTPVAPDLHGLSADALTIARSARDLMVALALGTWLWSVRHAIGRRRCPD